MSNLAETLVYSKRLMDVLDQVLQIGVDDHVGATMFSSLEVETSEDKNKIIVEITPNEHYVAGMARNGKEIKKWR